MTTTGATVGPFTLGKVVGRGGMATVYEAHHAVDTHPVAVKVLLPDIARDTAFNAAFADEVRAAAKLDHARITAVYDHGVIPSISDTDGPGPGMPWLAMELVEGGTISRLAGRASWSTLKQILLDVLDALAHAHARGLIHRDIKPANVLMDPHSGRIKLTDFGLAHSVEINTEGQTSIGLLNDADMITGTPSYMAPEQITNQWRDYGPWTDLYAVGALAWTLATGKPPYTGTIPQVLEQHLRGRLPDFEPAAVHPQAFLDWIEAMMAVKPTHRFGRAADAAWALSRIKMESSDDETAIFMRPQPAQDHLNVSLDEPTVAVDSVMGLDTLVLNTQETSQLSREIQTLLIPTPAAEDLGSPEAISRAPSALVHLRPPFPSSWDKHRRRRVHIHGAGLALYGVRATGVVGREQERDQLWASMKAVVRGQRSRLVLLEGASGSGKSTVAQWFCQRVDEVGNGIWTGCPHTAEGGPGEGLSSMLRRRLGISGLSRNQAIEHVQTMLLRLGLNSRDDAAGLVELSHLSGDVDDDPGVSVVFSGQDERFALMTRFFHALARVRPQILWLDEIHHGLEAQALVRYLLDHEVQAPIMLLGTVSTEDLTAGSDMEARVDALVDGPNAERVRLPPLEWAEQVNLMSELLGLEQGLASEVAAKCGGNPQFAVQLVGDWVERGLLVPGDDGFELKKGCDASVPANLLSVWEARLRDIIEHHSDEALWAIELGAVLGNNVDRDEWADALDQAGLDIPHTLISDLLRLRLVLREDALSGWSFVHALFRETVLKHAEAKGRLVRWSSICADVIQDDVARVARWARLLVAADRSQEALKPLLSAVRHETYKGESGRSKALMDLRDQIVSTMTVDPRGKVSFGSQYGRYMIKRKLTRDSVAMLGEAKELLAWAERLEQWEAIAYLKRAMGNDYISLGDFETAKTCMTEAIQTEKEHRLDALVDSMLAMCFFCLRQGDLTQALQYARDATLEAEQRGNLHQVARGYNFLARVKFQAGELDVASFLIEEAQLRSQLAGARNSIGSDWNTKGEIARSKGDLETAEQAYLMAIEMFEATGSNTLLFSKLNLATTYVDAGKFPEAEGMLVEVEKLTANTSQRGLTMMITLLRLVCQIHFRNWDAVQHGLRVLEVELKETGMVDIDIATTSRTAALLCEAEQRHDFAIQAWTFALAQFSSLGRRLEIAEATQHLEQLRPEPGLA